MADVDDEPTAVRNLPTSGKALKEVADFMAGRSGVAVSEATYVPAGARVQFFKGRKFIAHLLSEAGKKKFGLETEEEAIIVGKALLCQRSMQSNGETSRETYIVRMKIHDKMRKQIAQAVERRDQFDPEGIYLWRYEPKSTQRFKTMMTYLIVIAFIACCMFPIWPRWSKVGIWYISVTLLAFMFIFTVVRYMVFLGGWICGYDFWILPNVFADDLGFCDSFRPGIWIEKHEAGDGQLYYRLALLAGTIALGYWMYIQPTEFDDYVEGTRKFAEDIYSGNLLSDTSQAKKDNLDTIIPDINDLMKDDEAEGEGGVDDVELELDAEDPAEEKDPEDMSMLERLAYEKRQREEAAAEKKEEEQIKAAEAADAAQDAADIAAEEAEEAAEVADDDA